MPNGARTFLILMLGLLLLPAISAIGVSPAKAELNLDASSPQTLTFYAINSEAQTINVKLFADGELANYVKFDTTEFALAANTFKAFQVTVTPSKDLPAGEHTVGINVMVPAAARGTGMAANVIAKARLTIKKPYESGLIIAKLTASDVAPGQIVNFKIDITNPTNFDIADITGDVAVYDSENKSIKSLSLAKTSLPAAGKTQLHGQWHTQATSIGEYKAIASFTYAGNSARDEVRFKIGNPLIEIRDVAASPYGDVTKLTATVQNKWNTKLTGVYASFEIFEGDKNLGTVQSPTTDIAPNQITELTAYWQGTYDPAKHNIETTVHYGDRTSSKSAGVERSKPAIAGLAVAPTEKIPWLYFLICGLSFIVIMLIVQYFKLPKQPIQQTADNYYRGTKW